MTKPTDEVSPGGSAILRHSEREREWTAPAHAEEEEIEKHLGAHLGAPETVFHEIVSDLVHIDVHVVPPDSARDRWALFTTGMSARPMTVPEGAEEFRFAELMIFLPPSWDVAALSVTPPPPDQEQWYWPILWLKRLARFPHEYGTWLGMGHTIPNGDPPEPFAAGTELCCWLLLPPISIPEEARRLELKDGRTVNFYVLHALHLAEMSLKLSKGTDALLDGFERARVSETLDLSRRSTVRKKLFGLF